MFEDIYFEGLKIGYHLSMLKILATKSEKEIKEQYPKITKEIINEFKKLDFNDLKSLEIFFKKYKDIFILSKVESFVNRDSIKSTLNFRRQNLIHDILLKLKNIQTSTPKEDEILILTIQYKFSKRYDLSNIENRIKLASTFNLLKESTLEEIAEELANNSKKEVFRYNNLILDFKSEHDYYIFALESINTSIPWYIKKEDNIEILKKCNTDKYNQIHIFEF